jgi:hypothetical protein
VLGLVVLEAEAMPLAQDKDLACVVLVVSQPVLLAPGFRDHVDLVRGQDGGVGGCFL